MRKILSVLLLSFSMSACGSLFPHPGEPTKKYVLGTLAKTSEFSSYPTRASQIIVDLPTVYPPIDNTRIALKPQERTIDYYADVEWGDRLNALIQESLIYSLQNTEKFRGVSRPTEGIQSEYALKVEVRKFFIDQPDNPQARTAQADYMVHLVKLPERHIVASRNFISAQTVTEPTLDNLVKSLNEAHLSISRSLVPWLLSHLAFHRHAQ